MFDRTIGTRDARDASSPASRVGFVAALRWIAPSLVAAAVAVSVFALLGNTQPHATAQARGSAGSDNVAVIDVNRVLDELDESRARMSELEAYATEQAQRQQAMASELRALADEIDVLPDGPEKRAKFEEAQRLRVRLRTEQEVTNALGLDRRALILSDLFGKIETAAEQYAQQEGFTIVLSSDQSARLREGMSYQQVDLFLSNRRVLYAADSVDISQQVAAMMNNAYRMP